MNYHSDKWIMNRVREHYNEALEHFPTDRIVGIFLQGSQNYQLDVETSDIDTKLIVAPSLEDIAMLRKPVSTTHIRQNSEHIDFKDIRLYIDTFRQQNLNFLEILFTPYCLIHPLYAVEWQKLVDNREAIAHYNPVRTVRSMTGIAHNKYRLLCSESPNHIQDFRKYGYSPKEAAQLIRILDFLTQFVEGAAYEDCMKPLKTNTIIDVKKGIFPKDVIIEAANIAIRAIDEIHDDVIDNNDDVYDQNVENLLQEVQYNIMKIAMQEELK